MTTAANPTLEQIQDFKGPYPRQLWWLFFSEMWERFSFYGMRGVLTFFMVNQLIMDEKVANLQYGATQAFVYAFTFVGGLFADKILGFRRSLFWGGFLMIVGSLILAVNPKDFFFWGIAFNIVGTGFFKPNISTMVGTLYKDGDERRDAGFSLFYSGINVGAFLGGYICVALGKSESLGAYSWNACFAMVALVMTISVVTFGFSQKYLGPIGHTPRAGDVASGATGPRQLVWQDYATFAGSLAIIPVLRTMVARTEYTDYFMYTIGPLTLLYIGYEMTKYSSAERKKLMAALVFVIFSIVFWAFFEQSGGSLSLFAANNLRAWELGPVKVDPNGVNNAANSIFVIIFAPLLGIVWVWLAARKKEPNTVVKFGLGFLFLAGAFFVFAATKFFAGPDGITSLGLFTLAYFVITFGELCLSPIGLSIMTKLSPKPLQGVMMGMWFLASAYGQYAAGLLGAGMTSPAKDATALDKLNSYTAGYQQLAIYAVVAGVLLIVISPMVRKLMGDVK
ncbi:MAG: peptide MFS transporter [Archangium sp.]|nr:peptide MFS transporter [Archangium sp.]